MKRIAYFWIVAFVTTAFQGVTAAATISLPEILEIARQRNPDILAARKEWESMNERVRYVSSWPDPELGFEFFGMMRSDLNLGSAPEKWVDFSQTVPFPGKLRWRGRAASHQSLKQEGLYRAMEREILSHVKEAYYELFYAVRARQIVEENVETMRNFSEIAESKYVTGKTSQSDVLRAQVELSKMLNMGVTFQQEKETAQTKLNALLDRMPEEPIPDLLEPVLDTKNLSYADLEKIALANRPEIHAANHHLNHMNAELIAMKSDFLPDLMLQYSLRSMEGKENDSIAMVKFNLPFIWFWRQRAVVRSTQKEREHAQAMIRSEIAKTRSEIKEFLVHLQTANRLTQLYKTSVLPQAEQSLKVTIAAYQSDKSDFLALLDSQRALTDFKLDYTRSLSQVGINRSHLERVLGKDIAEVLP